MEKRKIKDGKEVTSARMSQTEFEEKLLGALKQVEDHISGVKKMKSWEELRKEL
jgi:hypothetical protein